MARTANAVASASKSGKSGKPKITSEMRANARANPNSWLYVIDECSDGAGNVFGTYRDPVATFEGLIKQDAIFTVPGSVLKAAREEVHSA